MWSIVPDNNGGWYIGGEFNRVGVLERNNAAHISENGEVTSWNPNPDSPVFRLNKDAQDRILAMGYFGSIGGQSRSRIAALDPAMGSATPWNPDLGENGFVIATATAGDVTYLGGWFDAIGGQPRAGMAAVDAVTGAVLAWDPAPLYENDFQPYVYDIEIANGVIYVSGIFNAIGGESRNGLAALDPATGLATSWNPSPTRGEEAGYVYDITLDEGIVYVTGEFDQIGGAPRAYVAALDPATGLAAPWDPAPNGRVGSIVVGEGVLYAFSGLFGSGFTEIGGQPRAGIAALDPVTGAATDWAPNPVGTVVALAESGGRVAIGGEFDQLDGIERNNLAAFDRATGEPTAWNPNADGAVGLLVEGNGVIYVANGIWGAEFTQVGGQPRTGVAALDPITGAATDWNPNPSGALYNGFFDGWVTSVAISNGVTYLTGSFTSVGGAERPGLAAVDPITGAATAWNPIPRFDDAQELQLLYGVTSGNGVLYVSGLFTHINDIPRPGLAALDPVTGQPTPWIPGFEGWTFKSVLTDQGRILALGELLSGSIGSARTVLSLDLVTGAASSWDPAPDGFVLDLAFAEGNVYMGGSFQNVGDVSRNYLAAVDENTGLALSWDPNPDGPVYAVQAIDGVVYVGGDFSSIAGEQRQALAVLDAITGELIE